MQTRKEALLARLAGKPADFIPEVYSTMKDVVFPGDRYMDPEHFDPYGIGPDAWGVLWQNEGPNPMIDGNMVAKGFRLFDDMADWKAHVAFPKLEYMPLEQIFAAMFRAMQVDPERDVVSVLLLSGQFERLNQMIGMENAMCAFYEYPDEMQEFLEAMCDYKCRCIDYAVRYCHPEVIHMHDDWGTNRNMFFSPELWREYIKPLEARYVKKIHESGCLYIHHSCGYIAQIIPDLAEIGVDAIEPMMVENPIDELLEQYGDRITLMGGLNNRIIDAANATESEIRGEVHRAMDRYARKGRYLPYYIPAKEKNWLIYMDEVNRYGAQFPD